MPGSDRTRASRDDTVAMLRTEAGHAPRTQQPTAREQRTLTPVHKGARLIRHLRRYSLHRHPGVSTSPDASSEVTGASRFGRDHNFVRRRDHGANRRAGRCIPPSQPALGCATASRPNPDALIGPSLRALVDPLRAERRAARQADSSQSTLVESSGYCNRSSASCSVGL
jgi:hypothetical protein